MNKLLETEGTDDIPETMQSAYTASRHPSERHSYYSAAGSIRPSLTSIRPSIYQKMS